MFIIVRWFFVIVFSSFFFLLVVLVSTFEIPDSEILETTDLSFSLSQSIDKVESSLGGLSIIKSVTQCVFI